MAVFYRGDLEARAAPQPAHRPERSSALAALRHDRAPLLQDRSRAAGRVEADQRRVLAAAAARPDEDRAGHVDPTVVRAADRREGGNILL